MDKEDLIILLQGEEKEGEGGRREGREWERREVGGKEGEENEIIDFNLRKFLGLKGN